MRFFRNRKLRKILRSADLWTLGGSMWDDYDENGIPYWHYFWHNDEKTGDGWRLIPKVMNWKDVRDGEIIPAIEKDIK